MNVNNFDIDAARFTTALLSSEKVFFGFSTLLVTFEGTEHEIQLMDFIEYLHRIGYIEYGPTGYTLTEQARLSGLLITHEGKRTTRSGDVVTKQLVYLTGAGYVEFALRIMDGEI